MFWAIVDWMDDPARVRDCFKSLEAVLDERSCRLLAAAESKAWGPGGISVVSRATGVSRQVIRQGLKELSQAPGASGGEDTPPWGRS
jgi:DNA-binding phage protein